MTDRIAIAPCGPISGAIRPPGSKSITNRALVCAALADGSSALHGALDSEDTRVMMESLRLLGVRVAHEPDTAVVRVSGCGGKIPVGEANLYVANSGTTLRFLTAMVALGQGRFRLDGSPRMRQRPVQDLLDALTQLGVEAHCELGTGCPPVVVNAAGLQGGKACVSGSISSQFLSGLLMAAPYARQPVEIVLSDQLVSQPYVRMTLAVMESFGVKAEVEDLCCFRVTAPSFYQLCQY